MKLHHLNKIFHLVKPSPVRQFARTAVAIAHEDLVRAVLLERITDYLDVEIRLQTPLVASTLAGGVLRLVDEIRAERPPTLYEHALHQHRQAIDLARARLRCEATTYGHTMEPHRVVEAPGYETVVCRRCGAAVSLHLASVQIFVSALFRAPCAPGDAA